MFVVFVGEFWDGPRDPAGKAHTELQSRTQNGNLGAPGPGRMHGGARTEAIWIDSGRSTSAQFRLDYPSASRSNQFCCLEPTEGPPVGPKARAEGGNDSGQTPERRP